MRRLIFYAVIGVMVWSALKSYEPEIDPGAQRVTTARVNLRAAPDPAAEIRALLPAGTLGTEQAVEGDWTEIETGLGRGWVASRYLLAVQ